MIKLLTVMSLTIILAININIMLQMLGVPALILGITAFSIGFYLPRHLTKWLYKEDNKVSQSEESER